MKRSWYRVRPDTDSPHAGRMGHVAEVFRNYKHTGRNAVRLIFDAGPDRGRMLWFWDRELE